MKKIIKKQLGILNDLKELISTSEGILKPTDKIKDGEPLKMAEIRMQDHYELMLKIESLIKVCVFTLDGNGNYFTESLYSQHLDASTNGRNTSVGIVLELVLTMLPKQEMVDYDKILELLSGIKNNRG